MTFQEPGAGALDYFPCRYGKSKLLFRGPRKRLDGAYAAVLGGTETYGKFVTDPYPVLLEREIGMPVVNFGCMNAGVDLFVGDPTLIDACVKATADLHPAGRRAEYDQPVLRGAPAPQ